MIHELRAIIGEWLIKLTLSVLPSPEDGRFADVVRAYFAAVVTGKQ